MRVKRYKTERKNWKGIEKEQEFELEKIKERERVRNRGLEYIGK